MLTSILSLCTFGPYIAQSTVFQLHVGYMYYLYNCESASFSSLFRTSLVPAACQAPLIAGGNLTAILKIMGCDMDVGGHT
ncbi:hypothetical protein EMCRGX_G010046 [Ephydatia muelleri]